MHVNGAGRVRALIVVVSVVLVAACSSGGGSKAAKTPPTTFTFKGEIRLNGAINVRGDSSNCAGAGRYSDLFMGASAFIADIHGKPIRFGYINLTSGTNYYKNYMDQCTFQFWVPNVPEAAAYWVTVGRQTPRYITALQVAAQRGTVTFAANPGPLTINP